MQAETITTTNIGTVGAVVVLPQGVLKEIKGQKKTESLVHQLVLDQNLDHAQGQGHSQETSVVKRHIGNRGEVVIQDRHHRHLVGKGRRGTGQDLVAMKSRVCVYYK